MTYPKSLLNDDEEIVLYRHPHWSYIMGAGFMVLLSLIICIAIFVFLPQFWYAGLLVIALILIGTLGRFLRWRTIDFVVTTDRIIVRQGILAKAGIEIPLDRVMNISYRQALWERMLGTGDLVIESAGESGHQPFTDVANPAQVQNLIYRQSELFQGRTPGHGSRDGMGDAMGQPQGQSSRHGQPGQQSSGQGQPQRNGLSVAEQLEKLAELRQRGVISDEEFQQQKRTLLNQA